MIIVNACSSKACLRIGIAKPRFRLAVPHQDALNSHLCIGRPVSHASTMKSFDSTAPLNLSNYFPFFCPFIAAILAFLSSLLLAISASFSSFDIPARPADDTAAAAAAGAGDAVRERDGVGVDEVDAGGCTDADADAGVSCSSHASKSAEAAAAAARGAEGFGAAAGDAVLPREEAGLLVVLAFDGPVEVDLDVPLADVPEPDGADGGLT